MAVVALHANELFEKGDLEAPGGGFTRLNKAFNGSSTHASRKLAGEVCSDAG